MLVAAQLAVSHHHWLLDGELRTFSSSHRYVWPSELDLMAQLAGMELRERWGGWRHEPFTGETRTHVSVWQKPPGAPTGPLARAVVPTATRPTAAAARYPSTAPTSAERSAAMRSAQARTAPKSR